MLKYVPGMTSVVMEEIPRMVTLAVDISQCTGTCRGCHSPFLREDIGEPLTEEVVDSLIRDNYGVNCFLFLGEGRDPETLVNLCRHIKAAHGIKVALYSGREKVEEKLMMEFDYVKVGPYIPEKGPLNVKTTNQRLYKVKAEGDEIFLEDMTPLFWRKGIDPNVAEK